jgi:hypothetical protein
MIQRRAQFDGLTKHPVQMSNNLETICRFHPQLNSETMRETISFLDSLVPSETSWLDQPDRVGWYWFRSPGRDDLIFEIVEREDGFHYVIAGGTAGLMTNHIRNARSQGRWQRIPDQPKDTQ